MVSSDRFLLFKISEGLKRHFAKNGSHWTGRKHSLEHRRKQSRALMGKNNPLWRGGITSINDKIRDSLEYRLWRESVFKRDNWICRFCGQRGRKLHADHIKPFSLFPELRFAIDNGRTLCIPCHKKTDTYGAKTSKKVSVL